MMLPASLFNLRQQIDVDIPKWLDEYTLEVVLTPDHFNRVVDEAIANGIYGLDLETTGLDTRVFSRQTQDGRTLLKTNCDIVGICLATGKKRGYYIPLRHMPDHLRDDYHKVNFPVSEYPPILRRLMDSEALPVVFNVKFEGEVLTYNETGEPFGDWDDIKRWHDALITVALTDSTRKKKGLKPSSLDFLDKPMIEITDLFPPKTKDLNFSRLDPTDPGIVEYACSDAICTLELHEKLYPVLTDPDDPHNQAFTYRLEQLCAPAVRWMERSRLTIDLPKVRELIEIAQRDLLKTIDVFYEAAQKEVGRDILPVSLYLLKKRLLSERYDLDVPDVMTGFKNSKLRTLIKECRREADNLQKDYKKGDLSVIKLCEQDPILHRLLSRKAPPAREGVTLRADYDIMNNNHLGILLWDIGIEGLQKTETGKVSTKKEHLEEILEHNDLPFIKLVANVRSNDRALGTLSVIYRDTDRTDNTLKVQFSAHAAGTGRFSTKGDKKYEVSGGTEFNLQACPAPKDPTRPEAMLRMREVIVAPSTPIEHSVKRVVDGILQEIMVTTSEWTTVAIDFSGVELRIGSILSGEKKWIKAFFSCSNCGAEFDRGQPGQLPPEPPKYCPHCGSDKIGDLHTETTLQVWGSDLRQRCASEKEWKSYRKKGKATNFALSYGGGAQAVQRQTGVDKNEAERIVAQFKDAFNYLRAWWDQMHRFARTHGYVRTEMYRKFLLPDIRHPERWIRNKAKRNATNSPIQGTSADVTKLGMGYIYAECKSRGWLDRVKMTITMHDELVFVIHNSILEEAIDMICEQMSRNKMLKKFAWVVPLTVDVDCGISWLGDFNLAHMRYALNLRQQLQRPDLSPEERQKYITCLLNFYEGKAKLKKKMDSLEEIKWPERYREAFKEGREDAPLKPEEKEALAMTWDMIFDEETDTTKGPEAEPEGPLIRATLPVLTPEMALELARTLYLAKGDVPVEFRTPDGIVIPGDYTVDPIVFPRLFKELKRELSQ